MTRIDTASGSDRDSPGHTSDRTSTISIVGRYQLAGLIAAVAAIILGSIGLVSLIERRFHNSSETTLQTVLVSTHQAISVWAGEHRFTAQNLAQSEEVIAATKILLRKTGNRTALISQEVQERLRGYFSPHLKNGQYRGFSIIGPGNINLASSRDSDVGNQNLLVDQPDVLEKLRAGETAMSRLQISDIPLNDDPRTAPTLTMFVGAPITDATGDVIAVLTLRIDPYNTLFRILQQNRVGQSGETFLFDSQAMLLSISRFETNSHEFGLDRKIEETALYRDEHGHTHKIIRVTDPGVDLRLDDTKPIPPKERPLTVMAASATRGESGNNLDGYRNYVGIPVIGAWIWDETLGFGLATEQNLSEAFSLFYFVRTLVYGAVLFTILTLFFLFYLFYRGRQQILDTRNRLKAIFDATVDGIVIIDSHGIIKSINPAMETMFGYQKEAMLNSNVSILMPRHHAEDLDRYLQRYSQVHRTSIIEAGYEAEARRADGTIFPVELSVNRLELPIGLHFAAVIRDITLRKLAENALADAEEYSRLLLESAGEGIYGVNGKGVTTFINPAGADMLGYKPEELLGKPMHATIHHTHADGSHYPVEECPMYAAFTHGSSHQRSNEVLWRKDGSGFPVEYTSTPIRKNGQLQGAVITFRDITVRVRFERQLEEANAELRTMSLVANNTDNSVIVADTNRRVTWVNAGFTFLSGYQLDEVAGKSLCEILRGPNTDPAVVKMIEDRLMAEKRVEGEILNYRKSGIPYWVHFEIMPVHDEDGRLVRFVVLELDITLRKEAEAELIKAREAAESATQAKSIFLATMSHEIRTPLNGVVGTIDMLEHTHLLSNQQDLVRTAKDSARMLQRVIDDVLDFSKIEAGRLELENVPLSLEEVLEALGENLRYQTHKQNVELLLYCDPWIPPVMGDPIRLKQILFNLAGNAVKFSKDLPDRSGQVVVSIAKQEQSRNWIEVVIRIQDNGIGMSDTALRRLFQPFVQGEGETTRRFGGTGLGLVITQRLVELMNGHIRVDSTPGKGSVFTVFLYMEPVTDTPITQNKVLDGIQVLLIKDEEEPAQILEKYLEHAGAQVTMIKSDHVPASFPQLDSNDSETVIVIDNCGDENVFPPLRKLLRQEMNGIDLRLLLVARGRRRYVRPDQEDALTLDLNVMRRTTLINAVAAIAGRESLTQPAMDVPEIITDTPVKMEDAIAAGRMVLLVDDNETNLKVIGQQLNMLGYYAEFAETGKHGLSMWQRGNYDLVLTDCHMPEMDGYQLSRSIRSEEADGTRVPIIAITADTLKGTAQKCLDSGMDDYLTKPIELHELRAILDKWCPSGAEPDNRPFPPRSAAPESGKTIDPEALGQLLGTQDPVLLADFYNDFLDTNTITAEQIQAAYKASDLPELGRLAHKLKSSARTVGANELADSCQALEQAGKSGNSEVLITLMDHFTKAFEKVRIWIEQI